MKQVTKGLSNKDFDRLKSTIDEAAIVAITDSNGIITYVNRKFCLISKYSSEDLVGKTHRVINSEFHPKEFFTQMWRTITSGQTWEGEIRNRAKDGTYYWVHTTIVPFTDEQGAIEQYVSVRYEITARKLAEEQLNIYAQKLEISNQELQDFASIAAHDLQEPLRKIQAFSDRVITRFGSDLKIEAQDYLDRIQNSARRMQILINDLLTYSRVTTKARPFEPVALDQILAQVTSDLEIQLERSKGNIQCSELPVVDADPTQMRQLFQNLISNAIKFSRADTPPHVKVSAKTLKKSTLNTPGPACQITIEDNGIGFDQKYLDRIFTIFQRLHGRQEYEGTGIGLAVCKKIIARHSGSLTATSKPGQGASFIITLPIEQNSRDL